MKVTALGGGVNEIGGNKFVFEHDGTKILLDIGMSFGQAGKYFDEFMQPRRGLGLTDFFEIGLLPDVKGLYRNDFLKHMGREPEERGFDAVFISHAHADHAAYLHFLKPDIPVICTKATKVILQALEETGAKSDDFLNVSDRFAFYTNTKGTLSRVTRKTCEKHPEFLKCREFITNSEVEVKNLKLHVVPVDHSLPGAAALIIYTDKGNFVYTGDIRFHGTKSNFSDEFVKIAAKAKPEIMMCEGTRVGESFGETEESIRTRANNIISKTKELAIVSLPVRDLDRLATFLQVAKDNKRFLTISLKQAYLLQLMEQNNIDAPRVSDKNIKIYIPRKGWGLICNDCADYLKDKDFSKWERQFIKFPNAVTHQDICKNQNKYLLQLNLFEINQLIDIQPKQGSSYIRSTCEPFSEEMQLDEKRLKNWLDHFKLGKIHQIHASGHAAGPQLKSMLEQIKPKTLIPIHTEHPEMFNKMSLDNVKIETLN